MKEKQTVLIAGASRGLGLELALAWAAAGRRVIGLVRSIDDRLAAAASVKPNLSWLRADICDEKALLRAASATEAAVGRIDLLVNNAAVNLESDRPDLMATDIKTIMESFRVNAAAPISVVKTFLPLMNRPSRIILISSEAGSIGQCQRKSEFGYCMSKAALNMFAKLLRNCHTDDGIDVYAVHPGWFSSDMGGPAAPNTPAEQAKLLIESLDRLKSGDPLYIDWTGKELPY